jgi:hypothetical protein
MKRKEAVYKGLQFIPVWFEDTSLTSPEYFQITEFPTRLTAGKNLFKLRGHPTNLRPGGYLNIEVLDYNGDPIYHEIVDFIDDDKSRVVAIYIYEETSPGDCTITLTAEALNVPAEWQGKSNVKWTRSVPVNPNVSNISEIIFETEPELVISEVVGVQLNRTYSGSQQFPTFTTGTVRYFSYNNQPAVELIGAKFTSDMKTGTLTVAAPNNPTPTPNFTISTTSYVSTIKKILTDTIALLDTEYTAYSNQSISQHTYTNFDASAFSLTYEATPTYTATQNSESFALIQIKGLEPATGDVSRVKVFMNNNGTVGTWELLNDVELEETEIFIPSTASLFPDVSIGTFVTQSTIDTYWQGVSYLNGATTTAPTLTWTTQSLNNSMLIQNAVDITAKNSATVVRVNSSYKGIFIADSQYKVTLDAIGSVSGSSTAKLSLYMSGSAFDFDATDYFNQQFPVKFGKRIGELNISQTSQRYDDEVFNFSTDREGDGVLLLVVEEGAWQVSDVRTTTDNDPGYSPNYTRLRTLVPTAHKSNNQLTFKAEYYNVNGEKSRQISYVYNKNWEGGNRYIDGDYSMLTGSLYVADSLESGVAISGYKNTGFVRSLGYEGFTAAFPGFLLWSGSALSGSLGTKGGVPYSGVGLELYGDANNYFRYSTNPSELDVHTETFFLGDPNSQYISGSNGNLEISSSGFYLTANGDVTASSFIAVNGSDVLFDSNSEFVDGLNVGRVLYFDQLEYTYDMATLPTTASGVTGSIFAGPAFHAFILPGETRIQTSFTYQADRLDSSGGNKTFNLTTFLMNAVTGSNVGLNSYGIFTNSGSIGTQNIVTVPITGERSGAVNLGYVDLNNNISNRQGMYVLIHTMISVSSTGASGLLKLKNFVFRSSRSVGAVISVPANPII